MIWLIIIAMFVFLVFFLWLSNNLIQIEEITFDSRFGKKICLISDLHSKEFGKDNGKLRKIINEQNCDFVCVVGDLIDDSGKKTLEMLEFLKSLHSKVIYIFGNHECRIKDKGNIKEQLQDSNVYLLENEMCSVEGVCFLGLVEYMGINKRQYIEEYKGKISPRNYEDLFAEFSKFDGAKILLSHFPKNFKGNTYAYCENDFHLQLSGHAHGGQIRLPFIKGLISPGQGLLPRLTKGVYDKSGGQIKGNSLHLLSPMLIVSAGLGNSFFPFRIFNPPHILTITL